MFSQRLANLTPYVPGEQPQDRKYIKLNTNENPYPPSPAVMMALATLDPDALRRYPDPNMTAFREAVAEAHRIDPSQVFAGNGSDEVLSFTFFAFFDRARGPLRFPALTYSFYPVYCSYYDIPCETVPLTDAYQVDMAAMTDAGPSCGLIFANPNAPTGIAVPLSLIEAALATYPSDRVVVVDEAYVDFGGETVLPLIQSHPNLLVVRTLSKCMSLAGMRLGYAMGDPALIQALFTTKDAFNSYPVDAVAQTVGVAAMRDAAYMEDRARAVVATRERFVTAIAALGWRVLPSAANFVLARRPGVSGKTVYETLRDEGILVRYFNMPGVDDSVRITIGTDADMDRLTAAMGRCWPA